MKQTMVSLGTAFVVVSLLVGCGKKKEEKIEKHPERLMEEARLDEMTSEESYVFDDQFRDFEDFSQQFAFEDEDQTSAFPEEGEKVASANDFDEDGVVTFRNIQFSFNSDVLRKDQLEVLHQDIKEAKEAVENGKSIEVHAYRCPLGDAAFNLPLSQRSANNIKKVMVEHGISANKIVAIGNGQEDPIVPDDDPLCNRTERINRLAVNRRAVIVAV